MSGIAEYYVIALVIGVIVVLWLFWSFGSARSPQPKRALGRLMFGPFWPSVDNYLSRRGGLTRRELIGWGALALIVVFAVAFTGSARAYA
jgi:hypothetical protein